MPIPHPIRLLCLAVLPLIFAFCPAHAQLRGHGGPVRALAISPDGTHAVSGSFDTSAIRWSLAANAAEQVLRFHDGAVNDVAYLKDGRIVTAGADARIAIWTPGRQQPDKILEGHSAPIASVAQTRAMATTYMMSAVRLTVRGEVNDTRKAISTVAVI